jgi:regulation of enolase protein 1 (concanavalin A-like superfamily)
MDTNLLQLAYKMYLKLFYKWRGYERTVDEIYYDQVHINVKSYRQLKNLLEQCGFITQVVYDRPHWLVASLSYKMLVIARKAK